jgi:hypothetical protein
MLRRVCGRIRARCRIFWAAGAGPEVIEPGSRLVQEAAKKVAARRRRKAMDRQQLAERDCESFWSLRATRARRSALWGCHRSATRRLDAWAPRQASAKTSTTTRQRALRRHVRIAGDACDHRISFILTLGGVVPPGASRDYFVARQNLAGLEIRQSLDPTVQGAEIDPGEFE